MKVHNIRKDVEMLISFIIIILYFRMPAGSNYLNPKMLRDIAKNAREMNIYPYIMKKHLQSTMLVEITGAFTKKERSIAEKITSEKS